MTYRPNFHSASNLSSLYLLFILNLTNSASPSISCQHELRQQQSRAPVSSSRVQPRSSGAGGGEKTCIFYLCGRSPTTESGRKQVGQICPVSEQRTFHRQAATQCKQRHAVQHLGQCCGRRGAGGCRNSGVSKWGYFGTAVRRNGELSPFFFSTRQVPSTSRLDS